MLSKIFKLILRHKFITGISLVLIITGGYFAYQKLTKDNNARRYVTAAVEKGTLIVSVSGSGQVAVSNQLDIKAKVSGDVVYVGVKNGQEVKAGTLLAQIDSREAQKAVRDAQTALETAKLELEELLQPPDAYSLMQAESTLIQAKDNLTKLKFTQESNYQTSSAAQEKTEDDLVKDYEDSFNTVANAFLDLPTLMAGLQDILFSRNFSGNQANIDYYANAAKTYDEKVLKYRDEADAMYQLARQKYEQNLADYKSASRFSETSVIESLIDQTYETVKNVAEAVKSTNNLIQFYKDKLIERDLKPQSLADTHLASLNTYTAKTNSHLSNLLSSQRNIKDDKEAQVNAERDLIEMKQNQPLDLAATERSVKEKEESLAKLKAGADELDIRAKKIAVQQKQDSLLSAQQNLADHYIRAPFDGVVAEVNVKKGESVSSSAIATLITKQKIAEISLNEVDVAKVITGQKTILTFDAVSDLSITGEVAEVDTLGTVTQGVVSYGVKIIFDVQDERIKPGMSTSVSIILESKPDVLLAPLGAVKNSGQNSYVEVLVNGEAQRKNVTTGESNDTMIEIVDGLKEGEQIITQTISNETTQKSNSSSQNRQPEFGGEFRMLR